MLDSLLDIEVAYSLIKDTTDDEDPLDTYYKKLKTQIEVCKPFVRQIILGSSNRYWYIALSRHFLEFASCMLSSEKRQRRL